MNIHRFILLSCGCLSLSALLTSCSSSVQKAEAEGQASKEEASVEVFNLKKEQLSSAVKIPGELIAYQQVDIYAKVSSFVKKLHVDVGSVVTAGQLLATMEAPELTSQLSGAESRLKSQEAVYLASKATYERLLETSKTPGTVSQNDLDLALAKQNSLALPSSTVATLRAFLSHSRSPLKLGTLCKNCHSRSTSCCWQASLSLKL